MNAIRSYFEKYVTISDEDWDFFSSKLIKREFPKNSNLIRIGQKENYLSFIEKGVIRFYVPYENKDITFSFAFAGSFASAYDYFLTQKPSEYELETITETILWSVSYKDIQEIYSQTKLGDRIGRFAAEELFLKKTRRELSLLNITAEKRYLNLFTEQPHLLKFIPLKFITSYIGITPQALSRIRKRIS